MTAAIILIVLTAAAALVLVAWTVVRSLAIERKEQAPTDLHAGKPAGATALPDPGSGRGVYGS